MTEKKEYRSAVRSRKWIRQAFMELLREKELEKITVTDIVKRADINRSTFYAHYKDIYALVEEIEDEIVSSSIELLSEMKYHNVFKDPLPFLRAITKPLEENQELYKLLGQSVFTQEQLEKLKKIFTDHIMTSTEIPEEVRYSKMFSIRISFFIGGIINVYQQWLQGNLDCSLDEITKEISDTIVSSAGNILDADWLN